MPSEKELIEQINSLKRDNAMMKDSLKRRDDDTYARTLVWDNWEKTPWYIKPFVAFDVIRQFIDLV